MSAALTVVVIVHTRTPRLYRNLERVLAQACAAIASAEPDTGSPVSAPVSVVVVDHGVLVRDECTQLRQRAAQGAFGLLELLAGDGLAAALSNLLMQAPGSVLVLDGAVQLPDAGLRKWYAAAHAQLNVASVIPFSNGSGVAAVPFLQDAAAAALLPVAPLDAAADVNAAQYLPITAPSGGCVLLTRQALRVVNWPLVASTQLGWLGVQQILRQVSMQAVGMVNLLACNSMVVDGWSSRPADPEPAVSTAPRELAAARIALFLQVVQQSDRPLVLQVTHSMGGGVERHVRELYALASGRAWMLVLRPAADKPGVRLSFGVCAAADHLDFNLPADAALLRHTLLAAGVARVHVHHVKGFPESVWALLSGLGQPLDLTLHDYSIIAGSPTLTNRKGCYTGLRSQGDYELADAACARRFQALAAEAQRCIVPSRDMQQRLLQALPQLTTQVAPHPDRECAGAYPAPVAPSLAVGQALRVLCVGALGREKGMAVLAAVAALARRRGVLIEFSLLGSAHIPLGANVRMLGAYNDAQLPTLLAREQPHLLWYPVQWPETWSYTLSAALEAGLPVLASDLGAFTERLQGRPLSWLQGHESSAAVWLEAIQGIGRQLLSGSGQAGASMPWPQLSVPAFYQSLYLAQRAATYPKPRLPAVSYWSARCVVPALAVVAVGWRAWLLRCGLRARTWPVVGAVLASLPYNLQRRVKRLLSSAPLQL